MLCTNTFFNLDMCTFSENNSDLAKSQEVQRRTEEICDFYMTTQQLENIMSYSYIYFIISISDIDTLISDSDLCINVRD